MPRMKPMRALFLLAGIAAAACARAAEPPATGGPKAVPDAVEFSFGKVPNDRAVEHVFKIENTGDKPLVVTRVQTSCGCTAAMMESSVIDPGQSGRLRVSFNPRGQKQRVTRTVTVHSNDPVTPALALKVTADVVPAGEEHHEVKVQARAHPREGRLTFAAACLKCHGPRAAGQTGEKLYAAACAACHGGTGAGVKLGDEAVGPALRLSSMSVKSAAGVRQIVAAGTGHPHMPGFAKEYGGPLTPAQVDSLVALILNTFPTR